MHRYYLIGLVIFLTSSYMTEKRKHNLNSVTSVMKELILENSKQEEIANRDFKLVEQKRRNFFSDTLEKDEFLIYVAGETIYKGTAFFRITNHKGVVIYNEDFPACLLIGYDFEGDRNSVIEKEAYIVERIKAFFNEENFFQPAIRSDESFFEDYSDKEIWRDIKSDPTAVGFYSLIGEGNGRKIAYSKKKGKVVMYHNCC